MFPEPVIIPVGDGRKGMTWMRGLLTVLIAEVAWVFAIQAAECRTWGLRLTGAACALACLAVMTDLWRAKVDEEA